MMPELMNCPHDPEGWCLDCLKTMIPRAKVAAAMEELRAEMQARMRRPPSFEPEIEVTVKSSARHWLQRLDATIAKLGLAPRNGS